MRASALTRDACTPGITVAQGDAPQLVFPSRPGIVAAQQSDTSAQAAERFAGSALFDIIGAKLVPSLDADPCAQPRTPVNGDACSEAGTGFELRAESTEMVGAMTIGIHPDRVLILVLSDDLHRLNETVQPLSPLPVRLIGWPSLAFDAPTWHSPTGSKGAGRAKMFAIGRDDRVDGCIELPCECSCSVLGCFLIHQDEGISSDSPRRRP